MDCIFFTTCCDKITCHEKIINFSFFQILSKKRFDIISHDLHVHILHLYKIH
jgi:hypothetical protein